MFSLTLLAAAAGGCQHRSPEPAPAEKPVIPVSHPIAREIADYVYYTGRTDAVQSVDIRARVTGYLVKMPFKEGAEVKAGDLLFEIDPRSYQAQYDASKAQGEQKDAAYRLAKSENRRSRAIAKNAEGAISREELEKSLTTEAQALADLNLAKASVDYAKLNLDFTKVTSPIDGHVSRYNYTTGNLVTQDQTVLTTIVSVDPMYVFFDMDERTVLRVRRAINEGKIQPRNTNEIPVNMGLEGEDGYPHRGFLNFVNNVVNQTTGTITVRSTFANPLPANGRRLLIPGLFVRIQLPIGPPHPALLVNERALGSDQGAKYVYVVDSQHKVQYRRVKTGQLQDDGLIAVTDGVKADDWIVVSGLPQVRPRLTIDPEPAPMPTLDMPGESQQAPAPPAPSTHSPPEPSKR